MCLDKCVTYVPGLYTHGAPPPERSLRGESPMGLAALRFWWRGRQGTGHIGSWPLRVLASVAEARVRSRRLAFGRGGSRSVADARRDGAGPPRRRELS